MTVGGNVQTDEPPQESESKDASKETRLEELEDLDIFSDTSIFRVSNMEDKLNEGEIPIERSELAKMLDVSVDDLTFDFEKYMPEASINEDWLNREIVFDEIP